MKVSLIVPTLNEKNNIINFLDSYSKQTHKFYEVIFVDGNSNDNTIQILQTYQKKIPEIRVCRTKKRGVSVARNIGLKISKGDYVCFMDADWKFLNNNSVMKILNNIKDIEEVIHFKITNTIFPEYKGLRKYFYIKDKNVSFAVIKKDKCPIWNEKLGFGEDRVFYNLELKKLKWKLKEFNDTEVGISRAEGNLNLEKYINRYMWYGRTIPNYILNTKDKKYVLFYLGAIISVLFPFFLVFPFIKGFIRGLNEIKLGLDVPFGLGFIEILTAFGITIGFSQWVSGNKKIGRD
jgi:glycosyltransferase involved in cell wall biosynthesis